MNNSPLLVRITRLIFPFVILYGFYLILPGAPGPGGGFQSGAVLATGILLTYFADPEKHLNTRLFITMVNLFFLALIAVVFINFAFRFGASLYLFLMNLFIGLMIGFGLSAVVAVFHEEGR